MPEKLISGDNHIDLTYLPPDLWSSEAPQQMEALAPRVEEKDDGLHWFVDDQDRGMWNGIGPGFLPYQKGMFGHIDEMKDLGFEWSSKPGAKPRPTTPELRLADLDRDGQDAEIIYGCLMINDLIDDASLRAWTDKTYNDWVADFAKRSDPNRVYPLAIIPNTDPVEAAAEVRRCAKLGLRGGDLAFKRMTPPLYTDRVVPAMGGRGRVQFPDFVPLDRVQGVARARQPRAGAEIFHPVAASALGPVPARHDGSAGIAVGLGRLREIPRLQLRARQVGGDLAPLCVRPARH